MRIQISAGLAEKLPDSVWLQHKDILYRLYILENKSLSLVKQTMEDDHEFPPLRRCDYEVALRDILRFRKNLKREEWRAIGIHISSRKRQAKESEVIWNNTRFKAKKVRKELLRNTQPTSLACLVQTVNPELPYGLVIRTPPHSPTLYADEPQLWNSATEPPQAIIGESILPINASSVAGQTTWTVQRAMVDAGDFSVSPYRKLRETLPFNRCMSHFLGSEHSDPLQFCIPTAETWNPAFPRLFGVNPSWELFGQRVFQLSNKQFLYESRADRKWFLEWIGLSADFALLSAFFSIRSPTAGAVYESLITEAEIFRMAHLLRVLFELRHVLSPNNSTSFNKGEFVRTAVSIGSRSGDIPDIVSNCLSNKRSFSNTKLKDPRGWASSSVLEAASRCDIAILRVLVDAGLKVESRSDEWSITTESIGRIISHTCNWDPQVQDSLSEYIELLLRGGVLDGSASVQYIEDDRPKVMTDDHAICSITLDDFLVVCAPNMRKSLQMAFTQFLGNQGSHISRAGVFMIAQHGATRLRAYLEAHQQDNPFLVRATLEECLLFTAILNDWKTAAVLLEVGVDPNVDFPPKDPKGYHKGEMTWNPSIVAAAAGNLEVLTLLLGHTNLSSFLKFAPIHQLVHGETLWQTREQGWMQNRLCQLIALRRSYLDAQARSSTLSLEGNLDGSTNTLNSSGRVFETLKYIRNIADSQNCGQEIDLEIVKAAVSRHHIPWRLKRTQHMPCDVLLMKGLVDGHLEYEHKGKDLLHLSIRNHCSFPVVSLLSAKGFKVHSSLDGQKSNSMLRDALLGESPDRSKIVEFLLEEGADCKFCGNGLTVLEASLWNCRSGLIDRTEYLRIFERLLNSGAPVHQWPRRCLKIWRPLICLLLDVQANDDLIFRVLDAGVPLNACGYGSWDLFGNTTPLQAALIHKRERLARELIRRGADVHAPASPQTGLTALQAACYYDLPFHFVEYLVDGLGVKVDEPSAKIIGLTSLAGAVKEGSLNTVEFLLDRGADVNATCRYKLSIIPGIDNPRVRPLDLAVYSGSLDKVELLLKAGGRSREAGLGGAISIAAERGHFAVLSVLRSWDEKYGRRILEEEALWQRQNPEQALMLSGSTDDPCYSETDDSEDDY